MYIPSKLLLFCDSYWWQPYVNAGPDEEERIEEGEVEKENRVQEDKIEEDVIEERREEEGMILFTNAFY